MDDQRIIEPTGEEAFPPVMPAPFESKEKFRSDITEDDRAQLRMDDDGCPNPWRWAA